MAAIRTDTGVERGRGPVVGALDEHALVAEAAAGHEPAFRVLIGRHLPSVTAIARRMLRDDAEAEDVAQEAFLRLWRLEHFPIKMNRRGFTKGTNSDSCVWLA